MEPAAVLLHTFQRRLLITGLALAASACASRTTPQMSARADPSVELELSGYGLVFAMLRVQGEEVRALIDTGSASGVRLSARLASRLGLELSTVPGATVAGLDGRPMPVQRGRVTTLSIAALTLYDQDIEVTGQRIESIATQVGTGFDAMLGWGFMSRQDCLLDFPRRRWQLGDARSPGPVLAALPYRTVGRLPIVAARVGNTDGQLLVDTGAPMCNLDVGFAQAQAGRIVDYPLRLGTLERNLPWRVKDLSVTRRALGTLGTLGNNLWFGLRLGIEADARRIVLS